MPRKKLSLIVAVAIGILLVAAGGYYVLSQKQVAQTPVSQNQSPQIYTLSPDSVGLTISFRSDNNALKFTMTTKDITTVDYTISYTANQHGQQVAQGLIGELVPTPNQSTMSTNYREFGTCSSGVCRYDTVVSPVTLTLKVTKTDGKVYDVEKTVNIPQH